MCEGIEKYRIALDVDGVLCNFAQGIIDLAVKEGKGHLFPSNWTEVCTWNMCVNPQDFLDLFLRVQNDESFWLSLPPMPDAQDFFSTHKGFHPEMYVTKRPVRPNVTARWLNYNGFPPAQVITVADPKEKLDIVRQDCDIFVDDLIETVADMRANGVNAVLYEAPYQRGHDTLGLPTIKSLNELCEINKIMKGV
jgi:5'' nucleotidase, deoxy (Pyrimidine), cytosolic type C protein (NT5C).